MRDATAIFVPGAHVSRDAECSFTVEGHDLATMERRAREQLEALAPGCVVEFRLLNISPIVSEMSGVVCLWNADVEARIYPPSGDS